MVEVLGRGTVEVAAYGVADAEHFVEKEVARVWPDAHCDVLEVKRAGEERRIAEEFVVTYRLRGALEVEASTEEKARREAFRSGRARLARTRFHAVRWEKAVLLPARG